jgi:flagellar basal body-associated protein FliL
MNKNINNKKGGFIKLIILIIVIVIILSYFNLSISGIIDWLVNAFKSVFS